MRSADLSFARFRRSGDTRALAQAYDETSPELLELALRLASEPADAEDLVQATWLVAIERASSWDEQRRLVPWLVGILTNEARRQRARQSRDAQPPHHVRPDVPEPPGAAEAAEVRRELEVALARLPEAFRPVVRLKVRHGLAINEIAAALERPAGTVRSQLYRGLEALRRALPAGIASAAVLGLRPTRGLTAVRDAVLETAPTALPLASATPWIGGLLVSNKLAWSAALVVVMAALGGWWALDPLEASASRPNSIEPTADSALRLLETPAEPETRVSLAPDPTTVELVRTPETLATQVLEGALVVRAEHAGGRPVEGMLVSVTPWSRPQANLLERIARIDESGIARFEDLPAGPVVVELLRGSQENAVVQANATAEVTVYVKPGLDIDGRVVDELGRAVPGAEIWLSKKWRTDHGHVVETTAADGSFRLTDVSHDQWLSARKSGHAPSIPIPPRGLASMPIEVELALRGVGGSLTGLVVDGAGAPIEDAVVLVGNEFLERVSLGPDGSHQPAEPPVRARTNDAGRFSLDGLPTGRVRVQAARPGSAPAASEVELRAGSNPAVELVLVGAARAAGVVRSEDGTPIAHARITTAIEHRFASSQTISALDGSFELSGLVPGTTTLKAHASGFESSTREIFLTSDATTETEFVLPKSPNIRGIVRNERGEPLEQWVVVALAGPGNDRFRSRPTDETGRFRIDLETGTYTLHVKDRRGWRSYPRLVVHEVKTTQGELELTIPDLASSTGTLIGHVTDDGGTPIGEATVELWHQERSTWSETAVDVRTGRFEVIGLPPGTLQVRVRSTEHAWLSLPPAQVEIGATTDLGSIVLSSAGEIVVSIRCQDGGELPECSLEFRRDGLAAGIPRRDEKERWRSTPLAPGRYDVTVIGTGIEMKTEQVDVEPGLESALEIVVERAPTLQVLFDEPADATVQGWFVARLEDRFGQPIWRHAVRRDDQGRFSVLASAQPGQYRLVGETNALIGSKTVTIGAGGNPAVHVQLEERISDDP